MKQYITLRTKTYGWSNEKTETGVIYNGLDKEEARAKIKEDFEDTIKYTAGDNNCFDDEDSYAVDDDDDSIITYAIHEVELPEMKEEKLYVLAHCAAGENYTPRILRVQSWQKLE